MSLVRPIYPWHLLCQLVIDFDGDDGVAMGTTTAASDYDYVIDHVLAVVRVTATDSQESRLKNINLLPIWESEAGSYQRTRECASSSLVRIQSDHSETHGSRLLPMGDDGNALQSSEYSCERQT